MRTRGRRWRSGAALAALVLACAATAAAARVDSFPVTIQVDAGASRGALRPVWRFFGADEPNYATMKDGQKLLADLGALRPGEVYFRAHNLLTSGDGTPAFKWGSTDAYNEDQHGNPVYDWKILDRLVDSYLERGVRPYVQIGFMPRALSTHPEPYRHDWRPGFPYQRVFTGWSFPPKDFEKWGALVYRWARHSVERYGAEEVARWYWQTWNEPNIGRPDWPGYFRGTVEEFYALHDHAIAGVRRALPTARVGGPEAAAVPGEWTGTGPWTQWLRRFLEHCLRGTNHATGEIGTPLDFVSFHAKGAPRTVDGHIRMGIADHLRAIDAGFGVVASFPELADTPIVIGEPDPEGCAACQGPEFSYRNGTLYSSYTAASFARKHDLADRHGVNFEGALTWAFTFEDQPYFAGFRQLASNGLPLPVFNVFRMLAAMSGDRVAAESTQAVPLGDVLSDGVRGEPDVAAFASYDAEAGKVAVMVWHYHDDEVPGPDASVELLLSGLPSAAGRAKLTHYRVDRDHGNAYTAWLDLGSPVAPDLAQYARLQQAAERVRLADAPETLALEAGGAKLEFLLPRQAVSMLVLEW